jgi:acyl carrier protein
MTGGQPETPVTQQPVEALLDVVRQLNSELHPHRSNPASVTLDSRLDRDLGFDSLERMELLHRLEQTFGVHLPEQDIVNAEVPRDLWHALRRADPAARAEDVSAVPVLEPQAVGEAPGAAGTLVDALAWHARHHPERPHITLSGDGDAAETITYADLQRAAEAVAAGLQAGGLQPRQTVALMLPTGREFFAGFFGILLAGGIPVPIYPPARLSQIEDHLRRQIRILANAGIVALITVSEARSLARLLRAQVDSLHSVLTVEALSQSGGSLNRYPVRPRDIAFLQYTSGSTGNPKGVILTHADLLANLRVMGQVVGIDATDVFVSWLPLYHDMGLIGAWLGSLYFAYRLVLMSPLTFLARPARWLWAIHRHRGTISAGPNFAYELCVSRIAESDLEGLDLTSWRYAFNGAEPVSAQTMTRFSERFAAYGFRPQAMKPVYGLAEVSLGLAFPPTGSLPQVDHISRESLMRSGQAVPVDAGDPGALHVVAAGQPLPGYQIRIVDGMGYEAAERQEGRLEFRGPSTTQGYYRNPEATRDLFNGEWLDSGDMAYIAEGTVYLTGRAKDMIIRAGRNIYPQEVEEALNGVPGLRRGCSVVFGSTDPANGTERLVVLSETRETAPDRLEALRSRINGIVIDMLGTPADDVVLAPPGSVLKTSSGKLRRGASRERYEQGLLGRRSRAVWWQLARLTIGGLSSRLRRSARSAGDVLYAGYFWTLAGLCLLAVWNLLVITPTLSWRHALARAVARVMRRALFFPLRVEGLERFGGMGPCVVVANHASYLDGFVLTSIIPGEACYVVKRELAGQFFARVLLKRLGAEFVERFDAQRGVEDTTRLLQVVRAGRRVVFFPEGTLTRVPGLQPFRMGAFMVAAQAGTPVVPVGIRGTRSVLRSGQWFPRRGALRVLIGEPVVPTGSDWTAVAALRAAVREQVLSLCGEPEWVSGQN